MLRSKVSQYASKSLQAVIHLRLVRIIFFWCLNNMSELLPVNVISEMPSLICFYHPRPAYPVHILLVPKKDIRDLSKLNPMQDEFLADMFSTVRTLIEELDLEKKGYRLIVNGGEYQEFPQLHFHLVSGG